MFIRILPTTLVQIFCENLLYFQVIFKSMKIADDTLQGNSECEWVKDALYPTMAKKHQFSIKKQSIKGHVLYIPHSSLPPHFTIELIGIKSFIGSF